MLKTITFTLRDATFASGNPVTPGMHLCPDCLSASAAALPDAVVFTLPPLISRPLFTVTTRADTSSAVGTSRKNTARPSSERSTVSRRLSSGSGKVLTSPCRASRSTTPLIVAASKAVSRPSAFCDCGPSSASRAKTANWVVVTSGIASENSARCRCVTRRKT